MMYITKLGLMRVQETVPFHVGQFMTHVVYDADSVLEVQADGDELAHILHTMDNLPYSKTQSVQTWYGDHAKFIVANW